MLTYWETLIAVRSNITVSDSYAKLWGKKSQSGYTVETYTGTLPTTLTGTKAGYLESYKIYGSTVQDGTPTPENPIVPSGCGERTENLYNWGTDIQYKFITKSGVIISQGTSSANYISEKIPVVAGKTYQLIRPITMSGIGLYAVFYDENDTALSVTALSLNSSYTLEAPTGASYFRTSLKRNDAENDISMFTEGSTPPTSYIPYGYKLSILSNSTVTNIYLGEVETTRRIKKLVLTGEEDTWKQSGTANNTFYLNVPGYYRQKVNITICSHYTSQVNINGVAEMQDGNVSFYANASQLGDLFYVRDSNFSTLADLKVFLAAQYAAGTPVTVWYVLAEPETGIVNEPLMKIGDYADTIDSTQTSAQIPTAAGETTISWAGEGLAPSEVEFVYKIKR